ncbi:DUF2235 domain-containing protein [Paraburkholderia agricolaris]|uniref:DUF2235 domain-containing protein n=1 Tax=Paraburkholderia agricolaris TaxID=2152888 RepID=A0ABW8ZS74_9BURK
MTQAFGEIPWSPQLLQSIDGRPVILGAVLFDGTNNDRLNVPVGERKTVVAHIHDELENNRSMAFIEYLPGVGTEAQPVVAATDAALAYTLKAGAEEKVSRVLARIDQARQRNPDADVRLLVSGFSRGSAAARHFMNTLEARWEAENHAGTPPRFYALIFDTVPTGQRETLSLQVPVSADLFYHFVSLDERRFLFHPVLDISEDAQPGRIVTIALPGVHSDIGTSYIDGVGTEYMANVDALLISMGLLQGPCVDVEGDARAQGKNDSRWLLEEALRVGAPNTKDSPAERTVTYARSALLPNDFWPDWQNRMESLEFHNQVSGVRCVRRTGLSMPDFRATRLGTDIILTPDGSSGFDNPKIIWESGHYFVTFTFRGAAPSKVIIDKSVLDRITERSSSLNLGIVQNRDKRATFWWFLDNTRVQLIGEAASWLAQPNQ